MPAEDRRQGQRRSGEHRRQYDRRQVVPAPAYGLYFLSCKECHYLRHFWGYRAGHGTRQRAIRRYHAHYRRWHVRRPEE